MATAGDVQVQGPLAGYAAGFADELKRLGYSRFTAYAELLLMAHVSDWMAVAGLEPGQLTTARVDEYLVHRRASGHVRRLTSRGMRPLIAYLRGLGVAPPPATPVATTALERLLEEFERYLVCDRGLAGGTVVGYRRVAGRFLAARCQDGDDLRLDALTAADVSAFMLVQAAAGHSAGSLGNVVIALRSLLRFAYVRGCVPLPLAAAVPAPRPSRRTRASLALSAGEVGRLLASCDRRTAAGRRDYAIVTVLARLGLRAGEVARLMLEDLDWRAGEVVVTGKAGQRDRLPLPVDVGAALAVYLERGRPPGDSRRVFVHVRAPYCEMQPSSISHVVVRACRRAGLPRVGAHRLRHTAATEMHRAGAGLIEIGQVLRHRHTVTTAIYAATDPELLIGLARPWPGRGAS